MANTFKLSKASQSVKHQFSSNCTKLQLF